MKVVELEAPLHPQYSGRNALGAEDSCQRKLIGNLGLRLTSYTRPEPAQPLRQVVLRGDGRLR
jgi:hypothetical protein